SGSAGDRATTNSCPPAGAGAGGSGPAGHGTGTGTSGGVISLSRTSSHSPWARAGRRHAGPTARATRARRVATAALLRPRCSSVSTAASSTGVLLALAPGVEPVDQVAQLLALAGAEPPRAHQVGQQRRQGAAAQLRGHVLQPPADQLVPADGRRER